MTSMTTESPEPDAGPELLPRPGFRWLPPRPSQARNPDSLDPEVTTTTGHEGQGDEHRGATAADTATSIPGFFRKRSESYAKIAGALLQAVGGWCNIAAGSTGEAFLPDDDDMETIPPPLGRLAARRIKVGDPGNLSDVEDMGMAAIGIIAWAAKGLAAVMEARRDRRRAEAGRAVHEDRGDGQQ